MSGAALENDLEKLAVAARGPGLCKSLLGRLEEILDGREMRFMEVCGTHTVAIFQSGLRSLLPKSITHISGPGCPVCVTSEKDVSFFLELTARPDVIVATFGDLLRVPGPDGKSLRHAQAGGGNIAIVYSPLDCLALARSNPDKKIVFLAVGFETTAPTVAATVIAARKAGLGNFLIFPCHKLVPPALLSLLEKNDNGLDAFLLPGHVAAITGLEPFAFIPADFQRPAVVGGFEPADLLLALCRMAEMLATGKPAVENAYARVVSENGNPRAREMMNEVFEPCTALWRGLGDIPCSGLALRKEYEDFDACKRLDIYPSAMDKPRKGCRCGDVLKGRITPPDCPLFGHACLPSNPVGPCMVSSEGSCAAFFKYGDV